MQGVLRLDLQRLRFNILMLDSCFEGRAVSGTRDHITGALVQRYNILKIEHLIMMFTFTNKCVVGFINNI